MKRVFVVGCPRSGTTLLQSLIAAHPAATSFTESHFFDKGFWMVGPRPIARRRRLTELWRRWSQENEVEHAALDRVLQDAEADPLTIARTIVEMFDAAAEARGAQLWVEKTPDHVFRIPLIQSAAGDASFLHVVRSGAEVVCSLHEATRAWGLPRSWARCALHWTLAVRATKRTLGPSNQTVVTYERMVADPQGTVSDIYRALGLHADTGVVRDRVAAAKQVVGEGEHWKVRNLGVAITHQRTRAVVPSRVANWIIALGGRDLALISR